MRRAGGRPRRDSAARRRAGRRRSRAGRSRPRSPPGWRRCSAAAPRRPWRRGAARDAPPCTQAAGPAPRAAASSPPPSSRRAVRAPGAGQHAARCARRCRRPPPPCTPSVGELDRQAAACRARWPGAGSSCSSIAADPELGGDVLHRAVQVGQLGGAAHEVLVEALELLHLVDQPVDEPLVELAEVSALLALLDAARACRAGTPPPAGERCRRRSASGCSRRSRPPACAGGRPPSRRR